MNKTSHFKKIKANIKDNFLKGVSIANKYVRNIGYKAAFLALSLLFFAPTATFALGIKFQPNLNITNEIIAENYYVGGGDVYIDSIFAKDLTIAGGSVFVKGQVFEDASIFGGDIRLENYVAGDLKVLGGTVQLSSTIDGDLVIFGGEVLIKENAVIRGNVILVGGKIRQNANLPNDSKILAGSVLINNEISGNTDVTTQSINFGDKANITGNLKYYTPRKPDNAADVRVTGSIIFNEIKSIQETGVIKSAILNFLSFWIILKFVSTLIIAFLLIYLFKGFVEDIKKNVSHSLFGNFFKGFGYLMLSFLAIVLLMISLIGLPISLIVSLILIIIIVIMPSVAGIIVGHLISKLLGRKSEKEVNFRNTIVGIILLTLLQFIGIAGDVTILIFNLVALGTIFTFLKKFIFGQNFKIKND